MSFDIFLGYYRFGELAEAPRAHILQLLRTLNYKGPDQFGYYSIDFPNRDHVEFSVKGLESNGSFRNCAVHVREFSDDIIKFIFDLASVGKMIIVPATDENIIVLVSDDLRKHVPVEDLKDHHYINLSSAEELGILLKNGYGNWKAYRDQILEIQTT